MRTKPGFQLRNICGEQILTAEGKENIDFTHIVGMNEAAAYLWEKIQNREFTIDDLVDLLMEEYDVDASTARKDVEVLIQQWTEAGIRE